MKTSFLAILSGLTAICSALLAPAGAQAQEQYPSKPLKIIVPFSPGGGIDILGRTVGQKLGESWKVPVVIENRPGASGNIGTEAVAKAAPDGYTLLATANTIIMVPSLYKKIGFDPIKDFTPVAPLAIGSLALVTRPNLNAKSFRELVAMAKANPGKFNYGSPGNGTPHHLSMELVKQKAGIDLVHVPYKGSGGLVNDVLGGQVDVAFLPVHQVLPYVKAGKMNMLAAGGTKRTDVTPDVPSMAEAAGISDIDVDMWYGMYLPAGTPKSIAAKISQEINVLLRLPDVEAALRAQGLQPSGGTPEQLSDLTARDLERWAKVVRQAQISAD